MSIVGFSLRRPVTISMFYLGIILFGFIAYSKLPQELFPSLSYPEVSIFTAYQNASPEEIENLLTRPLEETVSTVSRLKRIKSISREGWSLVQVSFNWGTDMDMASVSIREKIDLIRDRLPDGAGEPVVLKMNPFELPVMVVSLYLEREEEEGELGLTSLWKRRLKDELEKVEGVANSQVSGGVTAEIEVLVEPGDLWSKGLSLGEVTETLEKTNYSYPAGLVEDNYFEYLVRTVGEYRGIEDIKKTVLKRKERWKVSQEGVREKVVSLGEIARVEEGPKKRTSFSRYNGRPSLTIALRRQSGAKAMKICRNLRAKIESLKKDLPSQMKFVIIYDQSQLIEEAMAGVRDAAIMGGILSFFILYLFMRNKISSMLVACAIPISCLGGFILIYFSGISLNIISLGGFALGVGMMVDNAIVVVENLVEGRRGQGDFGEAGEIAAKVGEVGPAIFSSTLTTVATFLPMVFVSGLAGQMIKELAMAITYCLLFSLLVAFTFIPCFWKRMNIESGGDNISWLRGRYERLLRHFLRRKGLYFLFVALIFGLSLFIFFNLKREFLPDAGESTFYLELQMPEGTPLKATDEMARAVERYILARPETEAVATTVGELEDREAKMATLMGPNEARLMISLKDEYKKKRGEVVGRIDEYLRAKGLRGGTFKIIIPQGIAAARIGEGGLAFEIKGYDLGEIGEVARRLKERFSKIEGVEELKDNLSISLPEKKISLDREKIALYGLSVKEVAEVIQAARTGVIATSLKREGEDVPIRVRLKEKEGGNFLTDIFFTTPRGMHIPLREMARISTGVGPSQIHHLDQERAVIVTMRCSPQELRWSDADFKKILDEIPRPKGISLGLAGERAMIKESFQSLGFTLALAIVLIYMIMAAQFESLWQPFIIMVSLPLALTGVALSLFLSGMSLNIISLLGIILLGGIAVNNGIVLVTCIDQQVQVMPLEEAVVRGSVRRLRPVLMTTLTTIVGLIPLSLGLGKGAELRAPMAMAVMGGLASSTILTLFIIPALYLIGSRIKNR